MAMSPPKAVAEATRERKILDKKRKRMNMRREYEEQVHQQLDSSESSGPEDVLLRPGKAVTLDEVLSITKFARLVIQATPPYLTVHTSGAYTGLSGIESNAAVGKPITALLSPIHRIETKKGDDTDDYCLERLIVSCGYGQHHAVNVATAARSSRKHSMIPCRLSVSPVVSSHYGPFDVAYVYYHHHQQQQQQQQQQQGQ